MVREWELVHDSLGEGLVCPSQTVRDYLRGLQYQMSGNELWSATTPRYLVPMEQVGNMVE